jgi:formylglycine-generating enzyme required for sulfatase activity
VQDTIGAGRAEAKTRVFISYSRQDMAFADKIEAVLKARGFEVLIDRQEIYAFEDWWKRIQALIGRADSVVFMLSPDSVKSEVALKEVAHAALLNKRFAPIVCRQVEDSAVPEALRRLNFIFFNEPKRFDASADRLADALRTDIGWVRQHTEYGEAERRWSAAGHPRGLLLHSPTLEVAEYWIESRPAGAPEPTKEIRDFVVASRQGARSSRRLRRVALGSIFALMTIVILGLVGVIEQDFIKAQWRYWIITWPYERANVRPYVLSTAKERALKPGDSFKECLQNCPEMIVVPAGSFTMGSPPTEKGRRTSEGPQHTVTFSQPFAVAEYELTFADWDTCVVGGGCNGYRPVDQSWGRGQQPVINVNWNDAQAYVAWLSQVTGKTYRLLSEAEYEYATRAGTITAYPWGDDIKLNGQAMANCDGCGSKWDYQTAPVGSFPPNKFGLYDMVGNVAEWTEDCVHDNYNGAPTDGSAWLAANGGDCNNRILRAGSFIEAPVDLRSALRGGAITGSRAVAIGFRVGRTLVAP